MCRGEGASIATAKAHPLVMVDCFDLDAAAIAGAVRNAEAEGLADRVSFRSLMPRRLDYPAGSAW
jgi:23S rRNA G2445 N2-methylase RlmL